MLLHGYILPIIIQGNHFELIILLQFSIYDPLIFFHVLRLKRPRVRDTLYHIAERLKPLIQIRSKVFNEEGLEGQKVGYQLILLQWGSYNQVMPVTEKSLVLSLLKIYNWGEGQRQESYEFSFHSRGSSSSLLHTHIKTQIINRQLVINSSLRVTYTPQENQITVRMSRIDNKNIPHAIAEFVVNLDQLAEQKVQYFPLGKNDKVLKLTAGAPLNTDKKNPAVAIDHSHHQGNEKFIREREDFLKKINVNSPSITGSKSYLPDKTFAQKLHCLLREARRLRTQNATDHLQNYQNYSYTNFYSICDDPVAETNETFQEKGQRRLLKSKSQRVFKVSNELKTDPKDTHHVKQMELDLTNLQSQRHRLQLKDLRIVPFPTPDENNDDVLRSEVQPLAINPNTLSHNLPRPKRNNL